MREPLKLLDLFSGIGGFSLGLERSGAFRTVAFCEIEPFCRRVLAKHWPGVPICNDIRTMEAYRSAEGGGHGFIRARSFAREDRWEVPREPSEYVGRSAPQNHDERSDIRASEATKNRDKRKKTEDTSAVSLSGGESYALADYGGERARCSLQEMRADGEGHRPHLSGFEGRSDNFGKPTTLVPTLPHGEISRRKEDILDVGAIDAICGGFPCTDISFAGKGAGLAGKQSGLWYEYARLIGELGPRFVVVENVGALLSRGLDAVLGTLAALGYDAEWHCIPASYVGANHRRDRIWIVAYPAKLFGYGGEYHRRSNRECAVAVPESGDRGCYEDVAYSECGRLQGGHEQRSQPPAILSSKISRDCGGGEFREAWRSEPNVGRVAYGVPSQMDRLRALGNAVVPQIPELIGRAIAASLATNPEGEPHVRHD